MCSVWEGVLCVEGRRGAAEPVPNSPQLSLAERCICDVNMWGADENMHLKQTVNWSWRVVVGRGGEGGAGA